MNDMENRGRFPVRKNPRLKNYDYSTPNYYFVTICCHKMQHLFGRAGAPNDWGRIAARGLEEMEQHFPGLKLDKYVIMPNHLHAILVLEGTDTKLPIAIGQFKSYVTRQIRQSAPGRVVWQVSYHDHIIRNQTEYEKIWLYIESNPMNWEKDCHYTTEADCI